MLFGELVECLCVLLQALVVAPLYNFRLLLVPLMLLHLLHMVWRMLQLNALKLGLQLVDKLLFALGDLLVLMQTKLDVFIESLFVCL